ncbi:hypothetical protein UF75_3467 [Desulfosporosinus sp. I2]|nr:hypothetical protein UF75_3467 [Desulfosporosinus sp. I2]
MIGYANSSRSCIAKTAYHCLNPPVFREVAGMSFILKVMAPKALA